MVSPLLPGHLYDFQAEDARKLLAVKHQLVLLPQGAGKSVITLAAWEAHNAYTVVIVCPAILKADWLPRCRSSPARRGAWASGPPAGASWC